MCDTLVVPPSHSALGSMLFAKNSDRQPNEAQVVEMLPAASHAADTGSTCTYIKIPQVRRTRSILICRPFWMWGAEMGANDAGVVIGNEGLHARVAPPKTPALTGMDLVRLALERASSAREAAEVIISLLETHGQGGNCGHETPNYYNNGFLISDPSEALVLETVGRDWLIEPVSSPRAMSNIYSVGRERVHTSEGIGDVIEAGGAVDDGVSDYAALITDPHREHIGGAAGRKARSAALIEKRNGSSDVVTMMAVLRDHGEISDQSRWHPARSDRITICMHASDQIPGQTAGSLVSELTARVATHWVTATASPCLSIFKPVLLGVPLPRHGSTPTDRFDAATLWWNHEAIARQAYCGDFAQYLEEISEERFSIEGRFIALIAGVQGGTAEDRRVAVADCWKEALSAERRWRRHLRPLPELPRNYTAHIEGLSARVGLDVRCGS